MNAPSADDATVVIKLGALGDIVRTSYLVTALARETGARVVWVTRRNGVDLLRLNPAIAEVVALEDGVWPSRASRVLSLDDETEAARLASQIRAPRLVGAYLDADDRTLYTPDAAAWFDMGLVSRFGKARADELKRANVRSHAEIFAEMLGVRDPQPVFHGDPELERHWRGRRGATPVVVIGFNFFAGTRWPSKELPDGEPAKLVRTIAAGLTGQGIAHRCVLMADAANLDRARTLCDEAPQLELWDTTASVLSFAAAVSACDYLVSSDSLGLHLAIAQRVPNLSFYAPTSAAEIDTFGHGVKVCAETPEYCNYRRDTDNRSLTAARLYAAWRTHAAESIEPLRRDA